MLFKTTMVTNTYHGWNALESLPELIASFQVHNILLVIDPFLMTNGMVDHLRQYLAAYKITVFDKIQAEPSLALAEEIVHFTKSMNNELVIGIGGGSVLDLAKLAAVLSVHDGTVNDYLNLSGSKHLVHKGLPKVMIPTTSGTGSEVTNISVLSLGTTKDVIAHDFLLADLTIIDPALTLTVPPKVTAATGLDALTHAIESYLSINANPITEGLSLHAITLISRSIRLAVNESSNKIARSEMSYGSYLAGLAFFNAGVGGVHALAYPLGGQFHLSHGESNALLLVHVMRYIRASCIKKFCNIYRAMGFETTGLSEESASIAYIQALADLVAEVGIPNSLQVYGIQESSLAALAHQAVKQQRLLARSPVALNEAAIMKIYQAAWLGI